MSHSSNKVNRSFEFHYQAYLKHKDEPDEEEALFYGALAEGDPDLIKNSYYEKRRFRRTAKRLRRYGI